MKGIADIGRVVCIPCVVNMYNIHANVIYKEFYNDILIKSSKAY